MDVSAAMATGLEGMTLQQSTYIPTFDVRTPALKEFLQDVANGAVYVTENQETLKATTGGQFKIAFRQVRFFVT